MADSSRPRWKWACLSLLSAAMFIIVIDTTIMNVSITSLVEDLNTTVGGIQAAISLYALVMASFILIGGKLADIVGKKKIFLIGLVIFGTGTSIAAISQSLGMLIIGWSIMEGIGSALMLPNTQTILRSTYEGEDRAFGYGVLASVGAIGAAVGPIVGGFLTTYLTWRVAFAFEVVIVVAVLLLSGAIPKDGPILNKPKFDFVGAGLSIAGWSMIVLGILLGSEYGFWKAKKPLVIGPLEIAPFGLSVTPWLVFFGCLSIAMLMRWESRRVRHGQDPLFHPDIFLIPRIKPGFATRFTQMAITASFLFVVPLLLQTSFEKTAMETGIALLPFSVAVLIAALLGARLGDRFLPRTQILVGFGLVIAGLLSMAYTITPDATFAELSLGVLVGAGVGLIGAQILNLVLSMGRADQTPEVAGLNGTFEQLGNSIGVALVGTIMMVSLTNNTVDSIMSNPDVPADVKEEAAELAVEGVEVLSNDQVEEGLEEAGVPADATEEIVENYHANRAFAFQSAILFLAGLAVAGLFVAWRLPTTRLVAPEGDEEDGDGDEDDDGAPEAEAAGATA